MPTVDQVLGTQQPLAFKENLPSTYAIIDGSEVFIETPSDLHMQSSTWSQYKHNNTINFLVACTPNTMYTLCIHYNTMYTLCGFVTCNKSHAIYERE